MIRKSYPLTCNQNIRCVFFANSIGYCSLHERRTRLIFLACARSITNIRKFSNFNTHKFSKFHMRNFRSFIRQLSRTSYRNVGHFQKDISYQNDALECPLVRWKTNFSKLFLMHCNRNLEELFRVAANVEVFQELRNYNIFFFRHGISVAPVTNGPLVCLWDSKSNFRFVQAVSIGWL